MIYSVVWSGDIPVIFSSYANTFLNDIVVIAAAAAINKKKQELKKIAIVNNNNKIQYLYTLKSHSHLWAKCEIQKAMVCLYQFFGLFDSVWGLN